MKKRKISILFIFVSCTLTAFGQNNTSEQNLHAIAQVCHEIDSLYNKIEQLKKDTSLFHNKLDSLKRQWRDSCENYIKNASTLTDSDFNKLIADTRPDLDGTDLLTRLEEARKNNVTSEGKTPAPPTITPVQPVIKDPKEGVVEDGKPKENLKPVDDSGVPEKNLKKEDDKEIIKEKKPKTRKQS